MAAFVERLSVEQKLKLAQAKIDAGSRTTAKPALYNVKTEEDIERQRRRLEAEKAQEIFQQRQRRNKILTVLAVVLVVLVASAYVLHHQHWWPFKGQGVTAAQC